MGQEPELKHQPFCRHGSSSVPQSVRLLVGVRLLEALCPQLGVTGKHNGGGKGAAFASWLPNSVWK